MKITAIVPDALVKKTVELAGGATTTESLILALREWVASKELSKVVEGLRSKPLEFASSEIANRVRSSNRRQR